MQLALTASQGQYYKDKESPDQMPLPEPKPGQVQSDGISASGPSSIMKDAKNDSKKEARPARKVRFEGSMSDYEDEDGGKDVTELNESGGRLVWYYYPGKSD